MLTIDSVLARKAPPIVAILRGLRPDEAVSITEALVVAGIRIIEVPLNSPDPFNSIRAMQAAFTDRALIGAGTVLNRGSVAALAATGARLMVTPNADPKVIASGIAANLEVMPGVFTPTEALGAVAAGARRLKLFPASHLNPSYVRALREVLPQDINIWAVGGVDTKNINTWLAAGAEGVGVGGSLYRPGDTALSVSEKAQALVEAWRSP